MGTLLLYAVLAILVAIALVALLLVFLPGGPIVRPVVAADSIPDGLPVTGALVADDIARIRLPVGLRGYRMAEVDAILDRLAGELEIRDAQLAERDQRLAAAAAPSPAVGRGDGAQTDPGAPSEGSDRLR